MLITNFVQVEPAIATSGQPLAEQFTAIAEQGYKTVINLAMPSSTNAITNEGEIVSSLGMDYIHIPVVWETPALQQLAFFMSVMNSLRNQKVWVHCALNMRVSCFVYLYRTQKLGVPKADAIKLVQQIWEPNEVWSEFIRQAERNGVSA